MTKQEIVTKFKECFERDGIVWVIGNGGSSAEASHLSEEFISLGFPVIALNDPAVITALVNDFDPREVFQRYVKAVAKKGDLLVTLSTSGRSVNVIWAQGQANSAGVEILEWPRNKGGTTEEIQNEQLQLIHEVYIAFK